MVSKSQVSFAYLLVWLTEASFLLVARCILESGIFQAKLQRMADERFESFALLRKGQENLPSLL